MFITTAQNLQKRKENATKAEIRFYTNSNLSQLVAVIWDLKIRGQFSHLEIMLNPFMTEFSIISKPVH